MPETILQPDGDWVDADIVYQTPNYDQVGKSLRVDGAGNTHSATLWQYGNVSIIYYRKESPTGQVLLKKNIVTRGTPHVLDNAGIPVTAPKTVDFDMAPSGADLVFDPIGHAVNHSFNHNARVRLAGVYVPYPRGGQQPEDGQAPSFQPEPGEPGGGEAEVDYARIETIVNFVVSRIVGATQTDSLVKQITTGSGQSLRQALRDDLGKDADLGLLTGSDQKASTYKAALFDFTKNASANPWANVLGAQDAWGQQRQAELRRIIREEVEAVIGNQAKAAAPKKADSPPIGSGPKE